jgi:DNA-binding Xre family transcriptional regulator
MTKMGKKMAVSTEQRFIFLGSHKGQFKEGMPPSVSICHDRAEVEAAVSGMAKSVTWISFSRTFTDMLLKEVVDAHADPRGSHLITLMPPRSESIPALVGLFHPVFGLVDGFQWLPKEELVEAITRDDASERFIGGSVDLKAKTLTLLRGNITAVVAPFSLFTKSGDGTAPDFTRIEFTDYGRTVALGDYEASADAILYELDPGFRRKLNKQRRQSERSFGASLMRLRKQRRLKRSDFAPISSKEIARLERNEVAAPHGKTLETIAKRLEVRIEEISEY